MTTRKEDAPEAAARNWTAGVSKYLLALTLLVLMPYNSLAGQQSGDIVRVSGNLTAEFIRADSTGLHLSSGFVTYGDITSLELKVGTRSRWREGLFIGGGIGAATGLGVALNGCAGDEYCSIGVIVLTPLGALAGGVVGVVFGAAMRADRFTPILLPTSGAGMSTNAGRRYGLELGLRLRF